jgi:hypothetical protein
MDDSKCKALKADLAAQPDRQFVSVERFFDGNDDPGSIGCNLPEHPGMDVFRNILTGLPHRPDVVAVYARIYEVDPGEGSWPFSDTILVVGKIAPDELRGAVKSLQPDEIGPAEQFVGPLEIPESDGLPVLALWWD